jgi:phosphoribosylanthranilate isomerase
MTSPGLPRERWVKICGVTSVADARAAVSAGASALGLNFVPASRRRIDESTALEIAKAVRGRVELVGVVADLGTAALLELAERLQLDWLQLHGDESAAQAAALPRAFKAIAVETASDVARADGYPGERILVDAKSPGALGGTGHVFDWSLVVEVAKRRQLILAGGLTPENVATAVARVAPFGVDVASGVELPGNPRQKEPDLMRRFVEQARRQ